MSKEFVKLTQADFIDWADDLFGEDTYDFSVVKNGREIVLRYNYDIHGMELHIYTTLDVDHESTRDVGKDAIRIILYDRFAGMLAHQETKVLRVDGDTTVLERLTERVKKVDYIVEKLVERDRFCKCTSNRVHTVKRVNKKDQSVFFGCAIYGKCSQSGFAKLDHARTRYPLQNNPFQQTTLPEKEVVLEQEIFDEEIFVMPTTTPPIQHNYPQWPVDEQDECIATKEWPYVEYPFEKFNVVQSTVHRANVWQRDCNLILGTATSSGKTICAEMVMAQILYKGA